MGTMFITSPGRCCSMNSAPLPPLLPPDLVRSSQDVVKIVNYALEMSHNCSMTV